MSESSRSLALGSHIDTIAAMHRASALTRTDTRLTIHSVEVSARAWFMYQCTGKFTFEASRYMQYAFAQAWRRESAGTYVRHERPASKKRAEVMIFTQNVRVHFSTKSRLIMQICLAK